MGKINIGDEVINLYNNDLIKVDDIQESKIWTTFKGCKFSVNNYVKIPTKLCELFEFYSHEEVRDFKFKCMFGCSKYVFSYNKHMDGIIYTIEGEDHSCDITNFSNSTTLFKQSIKLITTKEYKFDLTEDQYDKVKELLGIDNII